MDEMTQRKDQMAGPEKETERLKAGLRYEDLVSLELGDRRL